MTWGDSRVKWLQNVRRLQQSDQAKVYLAAAAFVVLLLLVLVENTQGDGFRETASARPFTTSLIVAALLASVGLVAIATNNAIKRQRINKAASAIALAGMVNPLLRVAYTLRVIAAALPMDADQRAYAEVLARKEAGQHAPPLKWVKALLQREAPTPSEFSTQRDIQWDVIRELVDECVRCTVAKTRDWAPLLALTAEGMEALYCVQSLRVDLQAIQDSLPEQGNPDRTPDREAAGRRALLIALAFEDASFSKERRKYLVWELTRTPNCTKGCDDSSPGVMATDAPSPNDKVLVRHSYTVCNYIKRAQDPDASRNRGKRAEWGWRVVREIYEEQDQWRMDAE